MQVSAERMSMKTLSSEEREWIRRQGRVSQAIEAAQRRTSGRFTRVAKPSGRPREFAWPAGDRLAQYRDRVLFRVFRLAVQLRGRREGDPSDQRPGSPLGDDVLEAVNDAMIALPRALPRARARHCSYPDHRRHAGLPARRRLHGRGEDDDEARPDRCRAPDAQRLPVRHGAALHGASRPSRTGECAGSSPCTTSGPTSNSTCSSSRTDPDGAASAEDSLGASTKISRETLSGSCWLPNGMNPMTFRPVASSTTASKRSRMTARKAMRSADHIVAVTALEQRSTRVKPPRSTDTARSSVT